MKPIQSLAQKLIARAAGREDVRVGEVVTCQVDLAMFHDSSGPRRLKPMLEQLGAGIWDKDKVVLVMDHYVPERNEDSKRIVRIAREWARDQQLPHVYDSVGICHVVVPQHGHIRPGLFCVGGDSHSPTGGAFGAYMFGVGSTEMLGVVTTGAIWVQVPRTIGMRWDGRLSESVTAKDMMLAMIGRFGMNGGAYQAVEFAGEAVRALPMQERMTLANMSAELGAQVGLVAPDAVTRDWLAVHGAPGVDVKPWNSDAGSWAEEHVFDAAALATHRSSRAPRSRPPTSAPAPAPSWKTCASPRRCCAASASHPACGCWSLPQATPTAMPRSAKACCRCCRTLVPSCCPAPAASVPATATAWMPTRR
jgi:3-isopropylmalate/(R)-2-methylmalate dehydratase large subunit